MTVMYADVHSCAALPVVPGCPAVLLINSRYNLALWFLRAAMSDTHTVKYFMHVKCGSH